ncbi:MAG: ROK family protein, partial [Prevotella sp.]|nr:ROK family protein [Prevotella sp.]
MSKMMKTRVVGVDIEIDVTTYAIVDIRGTIIAIDHFSTSDYPIVSEYVAVLSDKIVTLVEANGGYETVRSVGISAPSGNFLTGSIENAANLPWKGNIPLAALMRDSLGLAVAVGNDAHASAIGERVYGSAHGLQNFVVVSMGHGGVGSCFFSNGRAHLGDSGSAGEIGHICVEDHGRLCGCGRQGCLERYVSVGGLIQTAREMLAESSEDSLMRQLSELTPEAIGECCDEGDQLALKVYRQTGEMFGIGLSFYASVINPEAIILTGGLTNQWKWLEEPTQLSFNEHLFPNLRGKV